MAHTQRITGFPPIASPEAKALVLGSMLSVASLEKREYYGNSQNKFWRIMGDHFSAGPELPYPERCETLAAAGIAVWDVLASCIRPGSLDSDIDIRTAEVNDLVTFLSEYRGVRQVFFNGKKAEQIFWRRLGKKIEAVHPYLYYTSLPSTSPAMASLAYSEKLERWHALADAVGAAGK
ncbi:MAG: DNA-deoxyinosine glycosylase [Gammaproteobacteria bacterium]|jgi:hypoxanthine-DNA glycosylase|nr:DNA-deoxyinosine glycosylase [Gammaproteobacteria bacterium]MDP7093834.1 DNA-deoxyinosine glycosylase [Gammaproteobacteria bacterium]MDP7271306.1 DNA-deoxyinosine glycosylase [Gammaproteobacteria bacterium]HJP05017.1 DNA-deoxyinosine glycosylase [Gammaproteobacteria bacterium]